MGKVDQFKAGVNPKRANWGSNFRVPEVPKIRESVSGSSLLDGLAAHDQAMELWRRDLERSVDDRISAGTTPATPTPAVAAPVAAPVLPPSGGQSVQAPLVKSVNTKTGDVVLTSDDVNQGLVNLYMTDQGWSNMYDKHGYARNYIGPTEVVAVPANRNMIVAGPLTIDGILVVEGILLMLAIP